MYYREVCKNVKENNEVKEEIKLEEDSTVEPEKGEFKIYSYKPKIKYS